MLSVLQKILMSYDDLIAERLSKTKIYGPPARKGLGRHLRKSDDQGRYCRGRKARKRGHRKHPREIATVFGKLTFPIRIVECQKCGACYSPLLEALKIAPYSRREKNFEHEVIESVIDTNYRRLIDGRSIDISLGGIHNIVVNSDIHELYQSEICSDGLSAILADGTKVKQKMGKQGELRAVIGVTKSGRVMPIGSFVNTPWSEIELIVKERIKRAGQHAPSFVYDGEPGLDDFLADVANSQRCTWHGPRGLYHALWEDGLRKKASQPYTNKINQLIGIELPEDDYELLKEKDKQKVRNQLKTSKSEIKELIATFQEKGYDKGASYLERLSSKLFAHVEIWLETGVIAPKTTSLLERVFREIGRRLKKIAWGWSDKAVVNLSKMIMIRQYSREHWEKFWKEKLGISGHFKINIESIEMTPCIHF